LMKNAQNSYVKEGKPNSKDCRIQITQMEINWTM